MYFSALEINWGSVLNLCCFEYSPDCLFEDMTCGLCLIRICNTVIMSLLCLEQTLITGANQTLLPFHFVQCNVGVEGHEGRNSLLSSAKLGEYYIT